MSQHCTRQRRAVGHQEDGVFTKEKVIEPVVAM